MKSTLYLRLLPVVICMMMPLALSAQIPDAQHSQKKVKYNQHDIPAASRKELRISASRKIIVKRRDETVKKLTALDTAIMDENNPHKRAALSKQRNELRAKLFNYEKQMKSMEIQIARMFTARIEVAIPSSSSQAQIAKVKMLQRQIAIATERVAERAKMGKGQSDPAYALMTERTKKYIAEMGSITTRLTPAEMKMLNASDSTPAKSTSKK